MLQTRRMAGLCHLCGEHPTDGHWACPKCRRHTETVRQKREIWQEWHQVDDRDSAWVWYGEMGIPLSLSADPEALAIAAGW